MIMTKKEICRSALASLALKNEDFEQCVPVYFDFPGILARGLPRVN